MIGTPLAVLRIKDELPAVVGLLLSPKAVFTLGNGRAAEVQIGASGKGGGLVRPEPPKTASRKLAEHILNGSALQRRPAILNGHLGATYSDICLPARTALREGGAGNHGEKTESADNRQDSFHDSLLLELSWNFAASGKPADLAVSSPKARFGAIDYTHKRVSMSETHHTLAKVTGFHRSIFQAHPLQNPQAPLHPAKLSPPPESAGQPPPSSSAQSLRAPPAWF